MKKEHNEVLDEPWMHKLKIAPLELDPELLDLTLQFREGVSDSLLENGWSQDAFMVIAASGDQRLDGQIIQGRHRSIIISKLIKDGHKFDTSKILIRREDVNNVDELRALRANYEAAAALGKDPRISKKWITANLDPIIEKILPEGKQKTLDYLESVGFHNRAIATEIVDKTLEKLKHKVKRAKTRKQQSHSVVGLEDWNLVDKPKTYDNATSYLRSITGMCAHCKGENVIQINVAVGENRELVAVELQRMSKPEKKEIVPVVK